MIDHANLPITDLARAQKFYDATLAALGIQKVAEDGPAIGYGTYNWEFGIVLEDAIGPPLHIAFKAASEDQVTAFYEAALAAGGRCNGAPAERPHYGERYFAAFIHDPDGHNIEAVFRG